VHVVEPLVRGAQVLLGELALRGEHLDEGQAAQLRDQVAVLARPVQPADDAEDEAALVAVGITAHGDVADAPEPVAVEPVGVLPGHADAVVQAAGAFKEGLRVLGVGEEANVKLIFDS
jgi:hypothetical protein